MVDIKKSGKKVKLQKKIYTYGLVGIVNQDKNRIKIVVRKVDGWNKYEFVSVIPVWKSAGYSRSIFFDEDMSFLDAIEVNT
jgi:hypothetical protein